MTKDPYNHKHVNCGGTLVMHHIVKKRIHLQNGKELIRDKEYYKCTKCGHVMRCTLFPSYEEMVINHDIPKDVKIIPFAEYKRIKQKWGLWEDHKGGKR